MLKKLLFFSKYDGEKLNEDLNSKLDLILENQKNILDKIEQMETRYLKNQKSISEELQKVSRNISMTGKSQEMVLGQCSSLLKTQKEDNKNIYGIVNQLLLKDLLDNYKDKLEDILPKKKSKKVEQDNEENNRKDTYGGFFKQLFGIGDYND